jgi:hypothetical protein
MFEARLILCIKAVSENLEHQGYRPGGFVNPNDMAATFAGELVFGALFGGFSLVSKASKNKKADDSIFNLAESFKQNVQDHKYKSSYYLWAAGMLVFVVETFGHPKTTKPLLDAILTANWPGLEFDVDEQNQLDEIKMQAEGTIMLLK